jgi:hypothetical protein
METDGSYSLGVWRQEPDQKGFDIQDLEELPAAEFEGYLNAIATFRAVTERSTHELLQRHWHRLSSMQRFYANVERVGGSFRLIDKRTVAVTFMGEVTNWLTTARMYLVSEEESLRRAPAGATEDVDRFRSACSEVFDAIPAYRFLYNLRDYAQHCGPPVGGLIVAAVEGGGRSIQLSVSRSALLMANFNWSRHARELIESWPEQVLLLPLIEEAMVGFRRIEDEILLVLLERCHRAVPLVRTGIARVAGVAGHPAILRLPDGDPVNISWQSFPNTSDLDTLEAALAEPDPLAALKRKHADPDLGRSRAALHAEAQAAAVLGAWLEHGPGPALDQAINHAIQEDHEIGPLISGLLNLGTYLLAMLATSLGSSSHALLGSFVAGDDGQSPAE